MAGEADVTRALVEVLRVSSRQRDGSERIFQEWALADLPSEPVDGQDGLTQLDLALGLLVELISHVEAMYDLAARHVDTGFRFLEYDGVGPRQLATLADSQEESAWLGRARFAAGVVEEFLLEESHADALLG